MNKLCCVLNQKYTCTRCLHPVCYQCACDLASSGNLECRGWVTRANGWHDLEEKDNWRFR